MNRILFIHRGALGDFLLLLPSLVAVRERYPDAHIEVLGRTEILSLVCPGIADSVASADRAALVPFFEGSESAPGPEGRYFASFDAVAACISDADGTFARNLSRFGVKRAIVRPPFPPADERVHVSEYLLDAMRPLLDGEARVSNMKALWRFREEEVREAERFLMQFHSGERFVTALHPGSGSPGKCWPPERFEALARLLERERRLAVLWVLGPADEYLAERFTRFARERRHPIAHCLPLRLLAAVLSKCSAYVGNDSGVTHLAAATGIPTLALFGPTDPAVWAPVGENVKALAGDAECRPCAREVMRICARRACLEAIRAENVEKDLREKMSSLGDGFRAAPGT